jgi:hypothetical protein
MWMTRGLVNGYVEQSHVYPCKYLCCHTTVSTARTPQEPFCMNIKSYYTASNLQPRLAAILICDLRRDWRAWECPPVAMLLPHGKSWQTVTPCHRPEKIWRNTIDGPIKIKSTQKWIQWACWQGRSQSGKQSNKLPHGMLKEKVAKLGTMTMATGTKSQGITICGPFKPKSMSKWLQCTYGYRCAQG